MSAPSSVPPGGEQPHAGSRPPGAPAGMPNEAVLAHKAEAAGLSGLDGILEDVRARAASTVLVGRADELGQLRSALARVLDGEPAAILIGGEAGVGKTRLVSEFAGTRPGSGARFLVGGCLELGADGLPFAPFTAVLRGLVRELGAETIAGMLPGRATRELARLLPELGEPALGGDPGETRARLFEQMLVLLERLAEQSPVILAIEDAHWADRSSRDLLAFLIRNQRALNGVLIVVTYRSDELHRSHPLRPLLAELARIDWVERIDVPRLTRREAGELAGRILGRVPEAGYAERLYRRAEGNPFFLESLLCCPEEDCELPDSLRDLLLIGVHRLPEESQEILRVASTGGGRVGHALLAAVTGLGSSELVRALRPAVTANTLVTDTDDYVFRHALISEAVHEDLLPGEHGRLHTRFAEAIDADPSLVPPGRAAIEMAHHWHSAHNVTWALISAWQAAAQAGRAVAHAERLALLARVLELWDQVPDAAERIGAEYALVLEQAVEAADEAGEAERGVAFASAALKELDPAKEPVRVAVLLSVRAHLGRHLGRPVDPDDISQALQLVPADVFPGARARILLESVMKGQHNLLDRALAEEALGLARRAGDDAHEACALTTMAIAVAGPGGMARQGSEPLKLIARARSIAAQAGAYGELLYTAINESHLLQGAGEHEAAADVARRGIASAQDYGLARTSGSILAINLAEPLMSLGRWDEAAEVIERAMELSPPPLHAAELEVVAGLIAVARGDMETAAGLASAAHGVRAGMQYKDAYQLPLAELEIRLSLAHGDTAGAIAAAAEALGGFDLYASSPRYGWPVLAAAARACTVALRQAAVTHDEPLRGSAEPLLGQLRVQAEKAESFGPVQQAYRLTFAAEILLAERSIADGDPAARRPGAPAQAAAVSAVTETRVTGPAACPSASTDARTAWDDAAAAWEAIGQPYPQAETLLRAAEAAMAQGDRDRASARLRRAAPLADRLRLGPLGDDIARLSRRVRPSDDRAADGGIPASSQGPLGLTAREFEVLHLVAAGRSNREIAGELFISAKTASVHVSNILAKLNVGSRTEAAATAHRLRLFDSAPS
jgi:DNA-binding CsgD family transcriptional regulator